MEIDGVEQLQPDEALRRHRDGALILDVRESEERAQARIPGSIAIPLAALPGRLDDLPRDRPIIVQCAAGIRSQQAARFLQANGMDAANLMHGLQGWFRMGQPVDTDPE